MREKTNQLGKCGVFIARTTAAVLCLFFVTPPVPRENLLNRRKKVVGPNQPLCATPLGCIAQPPRDCHHTFNTHIYTDLP